MLCNEVKRMVYFFLDGSLGGSKQQDFNSHLSLCPECEARTRVHQRLRSFIEKRLGSESAPDRLKQRLVRSFRAAKAEW